MSVGGPQGPSQDATYAAAWRAPQPEIAHTPHPFSGDLGGPDWNRCHTCGAGRHQAWHVGGMAHPDIEYVTEAPPLREVRWKAPKPDLLVDPHNTDALLQRVDALEARLSDLEAYCRTIVRHVETDGQQEATT